MINLGTLVLNDSTSGTKNKEFRYFYRWTTHKKIEMINIRILVLDDTTSRTKNNKNDYFGTLVLNDPASGTKNK